jgi:hypothetical protein
VRLHGPKIAARDATPAPDEVGAPRKADRPALEPATSEYVAPSRAAGPRSAPSSSPALVGRAARHELPAGIDAELRAILPRLEGAAELTDAELSALRSQLALVDRRQL